MQWLFVRLTKTVPSATNSSLALSHSVDSLLAECEDVDFWQSEGMLVVRPRRIPTFGKRPPAQGRLVRAAPSAANSSLALHPGGSLGSNLKSISHRCYLFEVAFVWDMTEETIVLPLGCQGGFLFHRVSELWLIRSRTKVDCL